MEPSLYAIYKGDEFIDLGTIAELAERRHVRAERIRDMARPSYHRKVNEETSVLAYKIEEDE